MLDLTPRSHRITRDVHAADPDAVDRSGRRRDLAVPDGVWWAACMLGAVGLAGALTSLFAGVPTLIRPALESGIFAGLCGGVAAFAYRRWGHQQFRFRRALRDGLWTAAGIGIGAFISRLAELAWHLLRAGH